MTLGIEQDTSLTAVFSPVVWQEVSSIPWESRNEPAVLEFAGKLWLLGGHDKNDIWMSDDNGVSWSQVSVIGDHWSARGAHGAVVFKPEDEEPEKMWVIGGAGLNDLWSSTNVTEWVEIEMINSESEPWPDSLGGLGVHVFNNKLWILGGGGNNRIWSSVNGTNWDEVVVTGEHWSARTGFTSLVHNGKMWVFGGLSGSSLLNDVWSSSNGTHWTKVTENASWSPRWHHAAAVIYNKMWIVGGWDGTSGRPYKRDIWSSVDGVTWTPEDHGSWLPRSKHRLLTSGNRLWLFGGEGSSSTILNELWYRDFPID